MAQAMTSGRLMAKEEWKPLDSLKSIWSLFADFADWESAKDGMTGRERHFREVTTDFAFDNPGTLIY